MCDNSFRLCSNSLWKSLIISNFVLLLTHGLLLHQVWIKPNPVRNFQWFNFFSPLLRIIHMEPIIWKQNPFKPTFTHMLLLSLAQLRFWLLQIWPEGFILCIFYLLFFLFFFFFSVLRLMHGAVMELENVFHW